SGTRLLESFLLSRDIQRSTRGIFGFTRIGPECDAPSDPRMAGRDLRSTARKFRPLHRGHDRREGFTARRPGGIAPQRGGRGVCAALTARVCTRFETRVAQKRTALRVPPFAQTRTLMPTRA